MDRRLDGFRIDAREGHVPLDQHRSRSGPARRRVLDRQLKAVEDEASSQVANQGG